MNLGCCSDDLKGRFEKEGLVRIPQFFLNDSIFNEYLRDLIWVCDSFLQEKRGSRVDSNCTKSLASQLESRVMQIHNERPELGRYLHALTSHPGKLLTQNQLRHHPGIIKVVRKLFGDNPVISYPHMSDSLGMFFPQKGNKDVPYNQSLPIHQDYPYMMQSSAQLVIWLPLSNYHPEVGGIEYWPGSNKSEIVAQKGLGDYFEVQPKEVEQFERESQVSDLPLNWELADLVIFDSNIFHRSVANTSEKNCRVTQIFRVSDLNAGDGLDYNWRSTTYIDRNAEFPKSVKFEDIYPGLAE